MKTLFAFALTLITLTTQAQQESTKYHFEQVGWTINLPNDFSVLDSSTSASLNKKGRKAIEESTGISTGVSSTITLISATKNNYNYFNSTLTPFDTTKDGDWKNITQTLKNVVYKTFADKMGGATIDSSSSTVVIGGLTFDKFKITVSMSGTKIFTSYLLTTLYKGYDFGITYLYLDDKTKDEIEEMLDKSEFDK